MSVNEGDRLIVDDFNTLADKVDDWFSDACSAGSTFGNPLQQFGWGGDTVTKVISGAHSDSQMNETIDRCNIGVTIINSVSDTLSQVSGSSRIEDDTYNNVETKSLSISGNKNDIDVIETSIHAGGTDVRTTTWTTNINNTIRFTFPSFNSARFFFNSGGAILLSYTLVGGTTGTALDFATMFSTMGTIAFDYTETTQSGTGGTPSLIGYYDLTTSWQQIFTQGGIGVYSGNNIVINAQRSESGDYVEIQTVLTDSDAWSDVDGTTTKTFQHRKLDDQSSGNSTLTITSPSSSVIDTFE